MNINDIQIIGAGGVLLNLISLFSSVWEVFDQVISGKLAFQHDCIYHPRGTCFCTRMTCVLETIELAIASSWHVEDCATISTINQAKVEGNIHMK